MRTLLACTHKECRSVAFSLIYVATSIYLSFVQVDPVVFVIVNHLAFDSTLRGLEIKGNRS